MKKIIFSAKGHKNILSTHKNTFEFTKDKELTLSGDCIIGVKSDFSLEKIKPALKWDKIKMKIIVDELEEIIIGNINKEFCSNEEIVVRITDFKSDRTLMTRANKASKDFDRKFINRIKNPKKRIKVEIFEVK